LLLVWIGPDIGGASGAKCVICGWICKVSCPALPFGGHRPAQRRPARAECVPGSRAGEIVIFDKAYVDFEHLADLSMREVFWVTRAKDNMQFQVVRVTNRNGRAKILRDDLIRLQTPASARIIRNCCAG